MSAPLPLFERLVACVAALACLAGSGWLAYGEFGPEGRYWTEHHGGDDAASRESGDPIGAATKHLASRRWEDAIDVLAQVPPDDDAAGPAGELRAQAIIELRNRKVFNRLQRQAIDGELTKARETFRTLAEGSAYHREARALMRGLR